MEDLKKSFLVRGSNIVGFSDKNFSTAPLGTVLSFAGQTAPHGYLLCDGASYKVADYPDLYAVIGNTYGGDSTNFNVPDYRETVLVGVGENTTDIIADHDVYELGEFKDDQLQNHKHEETSAQVSSGSGINAWTYAEGNGLGIKIGRSGTTTHGKQKGVTYIIKAFHTNEGVDSGVSDDVINYVEGEIDALVSDEVSDSTVWSSKKTSNELITKASTSSITMVDLGFTKGEEVPLEDFILAISRKMPRHHSTIYKVTWTDAKSAYVVFGNKKININGGTLYCSQDNVITNAWTDFSVLYTPNISSPNLYKFTARKDSDVTNVYMFEYPYMADTTFSTTSTWSSSKIASEINPTIDISKVFSGGELNIATLCSTYGNGRYVIVGQGTAGNGSATIDIWTLASHAISYIVNVTYSNKTSNTFIGLTYENPTINFEASYLSACNHIAKVCKLA